jgi:capsular polysaccharide biosynthesis protein
LPKPDEVGFQTLGPLPLRAGADCPEAQKTVPPECITVLQPRGFGADVEWAPGIGVTQSAAGYALCLDDAEARGASDLVIRADGTALHDTLCHPLAALANVVHDKAILLRARDRVLVRRARTDISIGDEAVTLLGVSTKQFGHWLFEHLPRLRHLEGLLDLQRAVYLVDAGMPETHLQALRWVIRAEPAIHHVEPECGVRVPSLWVGGRDVFFPYYVHQSVSSSVHIAPAHAPSLQWLRKRLTEGRGLQAPCRRLFVRRGTGLRSMNNQDEIESHLVRHWGFEVVQPELLDFEQQSRLFAEATWVIGPHGSALSNAVACPPGTRMLTLFNGQPGNLPSWAAALEALGIRHAFLAGQADTGSHPVRHHWRFRIDLAALDEAMSAMASLKA